MLTGKKIILGVTGGIAAYKTPILARLLVKAGADVHAILTKNAAKLVAPLTLQTITGHPVHIETFELLESKDISHTSLSDGADLVIVAPATANFIGKYAGGIADDLLSTTLIASEAPVLLAPAMNPRMWGHPSVKENMKRLEDRGVHRIGPETGEVACHEEGIGRMAEPEMIFEAALPLVAEQWLKEKTILVSAGPTREPLDPVRYLSNRSSGKMGYALARAAHILGAKVTLVSGPTHLPCPVGVKRIQVETAQEMFEAVEESFTDADALIMAAAVADFKPMEKASAKRAKDEVGESIVMLPNPDIVASMAAGKVKRLVIGFAAETGDADKKALKKIQRKGLDAIIANDVSEPGVGFDHDENEVRVIFADGRSVPLSRSSKEKLAFRILETLFKPSE